MNIPKDFLLELPGYLGLTGYLRLVFLIILSVSITHLVLPFLASLNPGSHLFEEVPNHLSFKSNWAYHVCWVGIIPSGIVLIYLFHEKAYKIVQGVLIQYKPNLDNLRGNPYIPIISLVVTSVIAFLIYRMNRVSRIKAGKSEWWLPNPRGKPALSTIVFLIWCTIVSSTLLIYLINHVAMTIYVHRLLASWANPTTIENLKRSELIHHFYQMVDYFSSAVYVLLPGILISSIVIFDRRQLGVRFIYAEPTVIVNYIFIAVGLFLLYLIPSRAAGLASTARYITSQRTDINLGDLPVWPQDAVFWGLILMPIWATLATQIGTKIWKKITNNENKSPG